MCQARVYLAGDGGQELVAEEVILLEEVPQGVRLTTFFDEPKVVRGRVARIDFLKHVVTMVSDDEAESHD